MVVSGASGRVVDENKLRNHVPHGVRRLNEAGPTNASSSRTAITVDYEYQLETFDQSSTGSTIDILEEMDHIVLSVMQQLLHSNKLADDGKPAVSFDTVFSEIYSACFTNSDDCGLVRTSIEVSYTESRPEHAVKMVTLDLAQDFLRQYTNTNADVTATYDYPNIHSTLTQFTMTPIPKSMGETEITVLQDTVEEVFGAIVFAIEGDTEVFDAQFVYQDLYGPDGKKVPEDQLDTYDELTLQVDLKLLGLCRVCTPDTFSSMVNTVIEQNLLAYRKKLSENGSESSTTYFNGIESLTFQVPEDPSSLDSIEDESIYDSEAPSYGKSYDWYLWAGIAAFVVIISIGCFCIVRENREFEKEDHMSTDSSEFNPSASEEEDSDHIIVEETISGEAHEYPIEMGGEEADEEFDVIVF